uniref:Col_cuticle_N domain-containing protein n=1 Tax=Ascaris lumbricoides TaxID=6252 RepID=A0A0M3IPU9_ASCLU
MILEIMQSNFMKYFIIYSVDKIISNDGKYCKTNANIAKRMQILQNECKYCRMNAPPIEKKIHTIDVKEKEKSPQNDHGKMAHRMRYCILLLTTVCLSSVMSNIVVFNFTVLCMTRHHGEELPLANESLLDVEHSGYTKHERTVIFSSVAIGALLAVLPVTYAIQVFS